MFCTDDHGRSVQAWQIPRFGGEAAEDVPDWLVSRLLDRSLEITDLGGLMDPATFTQAIPGDHVVHYKDGTVLFCSHATFADTYSSD